MPDFDHYNEPTDVLINKIIKHVSLGAWQTIIGIKANKYKITRDYSCDLLTVVDLKAEEGIDKEEIRKTVGFKQLSIYDERYSGVTFKLEIHGYNKDGWNLNNTTLIYILIHQFEMLEKDAESLVHKISHQL